MKTGTATRIQYFKGCRSTVRRSPHPSDSKWLEDMRDQLRLIAVPPIREDAEKRFDRIVARRRSLNVDSPSFQKEMVQAFDEMIEYLEQNDR
jgi:hypothetical protein